MNTSNQNTSSNELLFNMTSYRNISKPLSSSRSETDIHVIKLQPQTMDMLLNPQPSSSTQLVHQHNHDYEDLKTRHTELSLHCTSLQQAL